MNGFSFALKKIEPTFFHPLKALLDFREGKSHQGELPLHTAAEAVLFLSVWKSTGSVEPPRLLSEPATRWPSPWCCWAESACKPSGMTMPMLTPTSTLALTISLPDSHAQTCTRSASGRGSDVPVARYINTTPWELKVIRKGFLRYETPQTI